MQTVDHTAQVLAHFLETPCSEIRKTEGGHINDTYYVVSDAAYICQRLSPSLFAGKSGILEHNYQNLCLAYESVEDSVPDWIIPRWLPCREGGFFYRDEEDGLWRVYHYIDGETATCILEKSQAFCLGEGLARFHLILSAFPDPPVSAIPHYLDLSWYLTQYAKASEGNPTIDSRLDYLIRKKAAAYTSLELPVTQAIHGDAKLSNAVFSKGGSIISFIDTDTLMPGNPLTDLAECIRSCCIIDDHWNMELWQQIIEGYQSVHGPLSNEDLSLLPRVVQKSCFSLGVRYYTDVLSNNEYFKETHPGQNLEKAVRYLALLEELQ
ncbi:MAG: phosphotransferase [Lachnospiraceae bacterium]|nr:phosphotransferase [Lachnospiraceae bacterium]